jgi:hypothetical protein
VPELGRRAHNQLAVDVFGAGFVQRLVLGRRHRQPVARTQTGDVPGVHGTRLSQDEGTGAL